jgi:hypothetical protein
MNYIRLLHNKEVACHVYTCSSPPQSLGRPKVGACRQHQQECLERAQQLELDDDADLLQHDDHDDNASLKKQLSNIVQALEIASDDLLGPTASANAVAC